VSERELTMSAALNEAMHEEMERDPTVLTIGEDIAEMGGLFQVTEGLLERFGSQRVIDSPISTFFVSTSPSIGATMFEPWNWSGRWLMGMPLFSTMPYFSCAFSRSCFAARYSVSLSRFALLAKRPISKRLWSWS